MANKERVDDGLAAGLVPGIDLEATPACSASCISQAIQFGDFNDPASHVSQLVKDSPSLQLNAALGTDPQIKYLYTTPAVPGRATGVEDDEEERLADPANPLVGSLQHFWDWRAAMNWMFGGTGTGLAIAACLALWLGAVPARAMPALLFASAALVAAGLGFVFLKIGRKLRFWRAASRPDTSWMSREIYAVLVFFPAVLWSLVAPGRAAFTVAALGAAAFLACQAMILFKARGIPAWRVPLIPGMLVATGLLEGFGALAIGTALLESSGLAIAGAGIVALAAGNALLWWRYRQTAKAQGVPPLARRVIDGVSVPLHVVGHALPVLLVASTLLAPASATLLVALAGATAVAGGALWKFTIVVRASYMQGFKLTHMPQRGSGRRAAPSRMDASAMPKPANS